MRRTPQRVALALESSGPGGAERTLLHLADALRAEGAEPVVLSTRPGWMTERAGAAGHRVRIIPQTRGLDPGFVPRLARLLRHERIELLHSHEFAMNVYGGLAARLARLPHVATLHGRRWVLERRRRVWAHRVLLRLGSRLVAVSEDLRDFLAAGLGVPRERIAVVANGVPPLPEIPEAARAALRDELGVPPGGALLVAVGNLYPVKDHATLLRALPALAPALHVAIAGRGGEEAALRSLAKTLGVEARVHLLGVREDVATLLAAGDLLVHPSRSEGLPLAVLEAMQAALPVVATRVGGVPEAVQDGVTGRLVPAGDAAALAAAVAAVLGAPDRGRGLGAAGRARARAEFSVEAMRRRYRALYAGSGGASASDG